MSQLYQIHLLLMWWYTHNDFISPCTKQTIQSDPNFAKTQSYNVKHHQALKLKSKHFSDLENATLKFKEFKHSYEPWLYIVYPAHCTESWDGAVF